MTGHFGDRAVRLYAVAARILGWRPLEFWAATPAELLAALAPTEAKTEAGFNRTELKRLMEQDDA